MCARVPAGPHGVEMAEQEDGRGVGTLGTEAELHDIAEVLLAVNLDTPVERGLRSAGRDRAAVLTRAGSSLGGLLLDEGTEVDLEGRKKALGDVEEVLHEGISIGRLPE